MILEESCISKIFKNATVNVKHIFLLVVISCLVQAGYSQVLLTPQLPPGGLLQKKQLWNVIVVNNSSRSLDVQIQVTMVDRNSGQQIMNATSRMRSVARGATQLKEQDLAPIQYNFTGAYAATDRVTGDLLMAGGYIICYTVIAAHEKGITPLSEECVNIDIEPLSPPQLIHPADTSTIETSYPGFNWMPPAPLAMFTQLQYEILVVEMRKGQNPYDAIQRNIPVYRQQFLSSPVLQYPSSYKALEPGKTYAWQVVARNGAMYTQKTDAWSFSVKKEEQSLLMSSTMFPLLQRDDFSKTYLSEGLLAFEYFNETGDSSVVADVYSWQSGLGPKVESKKLKVKQGQNFLSVRLPGNRYQPEAEYVVEIYNSRKERWNLKFKYVKNSENDQ